MVFLFLCFYVFYACFKINGFGFFFLCPDYASQIDLFQRDSDNDDENEQFDDTEVKWRKERFEREQWLREQVLVTFKKGILLSVYTIARCEIASSSSLNSRNNTVPKCIFEFIVDSTLLQVLYKEK